MKRKILTAVTLSFLPLAVSAAGTSATFCPEVWRKGVLTAPFNVAFLHVQSFDAPDGSKRDGLLMSSFFNAVKDAEGRKVERLTEAKIAARLLQGASNVEKQKVWRTSVILGNRSRAHC